MERLEFEKKFLDLVNRSEVVITAANIAYQLDIGIDETQEHLLGLELNGILRQATDKSGGTYYVMHNRPAAGTPRVDATAEAKALPASGIHDPAHLAPATIYGGAKAAPVKGRNVNGLVLNVLFPGVGSLVCGQMVGAAILGLLLLGLLMFLFLGGWAKLSGFLPIFASWIWSIVAGIQLFNEREPGPGRPR
ncbi:MAG: hypothetical protein H6707_08910 [Deltaproteobacteria bacterium]|nr:hypothetical protein [Deltaproteobacteria bacterium]